MIEALPEDERPPLIIVAEDDGDMRALVASSLRSDGYDVLEAADGAELLFIVHVARALSARGTERPAMIISDLRMPYASGTDVLSRLRDEWIAVPFIVLSAFVDETSRAIAKSLGAVAVLAKPCPMKDLRELVGMLVPIEAH